MQHRANWTPELVAEALVEAFRAMPGMAIYSPRTDVLLVVDGQRSDRLEIVALTARYLGRQSAERIMLLTWARCRALQESIRELCRERDWPRRMFYRRRGRALRTIARGLERDAIAAGAAVLASDKASSRNPKNPTPHRGTARRRKSPMSLSTSRAQ